LATVVATDSRFCCTLTAAARLGRRSVERVSRSIASTLARSGGALGGLISRSSGSGPPDPSPLPRLPTSGRFRTSDELAMGNGVLISVLTGPDGAMSDGCGSCFRLKFSDGHMTSPLWTSQNGRNSELSLPIRAVEPAHAPWSPSTS